ncbi:hypothetical protein NQZ68_008746, partial [Dissostichus eleginoides]
GESESGEEKQQDGELSDRQREGGGGHSALLDSSLALPLNLWIPLLPGHAVRPVQEVEERGASAQDSPQDGSRRWKRRWLG